VLGVDAVPHAAKVIEVQAFGDRADKRLIRDAMRRVRPLVDIDDRVTRAVLLLSRPQPAPIGIDLDIALDPRPQVLCSAASALLRAPLPEGSLDD
jgi:hypothetical protein